MLIASSPVAVPVAVTVALGMAIALAVAGTTSMNGAIAITMGRGAVAVGERRLNIHLGLAQQHVTPLVYGRCDVGPQSQLLGAARMPHLQYDARAAMAKPAQFLEPPRRQI